MYKVLESGLGLSQVGSRTELWIILQYEASECGFDMALEAAALLVTAKVAPEDIQHQGCSLLQLAGRC